MSRPGKDSETETNAPDQVALIAAALGTVLGTSLTWAVFITPARPEMAIYIALLALFHLLEYWITARYNTVRVSTTCNQVTRGVTSLTTAFLLTSNGKAYWMALISGILEHTIISRRYTATTLSQGRVPVAFSLGFVLLMIGQAVRSLAMIHAGKSFSHQLAVQKHDEHVLVQDGIYKYMRHPSYFGFFWFGVGTQIMMSNVLSTCIFAVVLHRFFSARIR